jgi:Holliday junction resolvase
MAESKIQAKIIKHLEKAGCHVIKVVTANHSGNPDIIACFHGIFIAIEVKQPGKAATLLQQAKISAIRKAGGIAIVAHSVDEVQAVLNHLEGIIRKGLTEKADKSRIAIIKTNP